MEKDIWVLHMLQYIFRRKQVMQLRESEAHCAGTIKGYWPFIGIIILLGNKIIVTEVISIEVAELQTNHSTALFTNISSGSAESLTCFPNS